MSDRRPENPKPIDLDALHKVLIDQRDRLEAMEDIDAADVANELSSVIARLPIDPVAVVRRGVESGTIKGERVESLGVTFDEVPDGKDGLILAVDSRGWLVGSQPKRYLLIPVDGGEDT